MNQEIINLRHTIHQNPEISNHEFETSKRIYDFVSKYKPDKIIKLSNTGLAFIFDSNVPGKTTMFRAELDALPISEISELEYSSQNKDISHSCGHDGHMTIVAGLAQKIAKNRPQKGRVVLLFQPAEEVEQGARDVVEDPKFKEIEPDFIFALHNIPGEEKHQILLKKGSFAAASKGMTINLAGKTSHAAEPENGINPAMAVSLIIKELDELIKNTTLFKELSLLTFIYIRLGEISFGTSAGKAEIGITLRSFKNSDMQILTEKAEIIIKEICKNEKLICNISYDEVFPATENSDKCFEMIKKSAEKNNLKLKYIEKPYKWSEDFGYYSEKYSGGFFGLGSGVEQPALHNPDYNFPDEILETGINMFFNIYKEINL